MPLTIETTALEMLESGCVVADAQQAWMWNSCGTVAKTLPSCLRDMGIRPAFVCSAVGGVMALALVGAEGVSRWNALPIVGWPAKGSSAVGVKIEMGVSGDGEVEVVVLGEVVLGWCMKTVSD